MKAILAVITLALFALVMEERARVVASDAQEAVGGAVDQARDATEAVSRSVVQQPIAAILIAGGLGYVLARLTPGR
jgi:hypothetical protein